MVSEPNDLPKAQFSLRNTGQCDSTLLDSIRTGRFVIGCQHSSLMRTVSLNKLMLDVLGRGDAKENVTQTITLSTLTVTMGANYGLDRDTLEWSYIHVCGIMAATHRSAILECIVRPHVCAIGDAIILMQVIARAHKGEVLTEGDYAPIRT